MNSFKITLLFACIIFVMVGCLDNSISDTTTPELSTRENYYIANQSNLELTLIFKLKATRKDSTISIPADTTVIILESGGIGGGSTPYTTFKNLRFYKKSSDTSTLILTIEPARRPNLSDRWNLTAGNNDNPAKYVLTITNEDIN